ncbi:hypothetical protein PSOS111911_15800 [Pseudoalteromonas ostreae]
MKITGLTSILKAIASIPILDAAVSIAIGIWAPYALPLYQGLKTYAVTGSFGAALKAYVISSATIVISQYIGANLDFDLGGWTAVQNVASHAMVGGVSAVLQGGKFGHGFVSSLVTASMKGFMNPKTTEFGNAYSRTAIAGVVGGTVSKLTGGKFANGAVTSAMQWWYNAEKGGFEEDFKNAKKLVHAQGKFNNTDDAAKWLHKNVYENLLNEYDIEVGAAMYGSEGDIRLGDLQTNGPGNLISLHVKKDAVSVWHSHGTNGSVAWPSVGSDADTGAAYNAGYQHEYISTPDFYGEGRTLWKMNGGAFNSPEKHNQSTLCINITIIEGGGSCNW